MPMMALGVFSHFVRYGLPLFLVCVLPHFAAADDSWVGKTILLKKSDVRIGHTDKDGREVHDAVLNELAYEVLAQQGNWVLVRHNNVDGWFDRADAVLLEDAIDFFTQRIHTNPKDSTAYDKRAVAWFLWGEPDQAIKDYDEAIRLNPQDALAFFYRGFTWFIKQEYDLALRDYDEAIRLDPRHALSSDNCFSHSATIRIPGRPYSGQRADDN